MTVINAMMQNLRLHASCLHTKGEIFLVIHDKRFSFVEIFVSIRSSAKADGWLSGKHDRLPLNYGHAPSWGVVM